MCEKIVVKKAFGSGYFGEWVEDEFGLPAYHYTCDQINDPKAITPMNEAWRSKTDHIHLVGNDRLAGVASNYGYIQVRQDEGSPKFLNEYDPEHGHYAGGFGYLIDGKNFLNTFYPGNGENFDRLFGIGYYRKKVSGMGLCADQVVFAPYGDDPILISQITITNYREKAVDLRWVEYWGCQMYQFSPDAYFFALREKNVSLTREFRHQFSNKFFHDFKILNEDIGFLETKYFENRRDEKQDSILKAVMKDTNPPKTFLVSLDAKPNGLSTGASSFFGNGGVSSPERLIDPLNSINVEDDIENGMLLERKIHLNPNESQTIYFAYGYITNDFKIETLINKYKQNLSELLETSCEKWKANHISLKLPEKLWVNRELIWHNYYLRGCMTYDSYFQEHILSQGQIYQYIIGFQGALRDPLQHALPFIYCEPKIVKEIIRYVLKATTPDGEIPYAIAGSGMILRAPYKPSDQQMWLLWLVSEYILVTRDIDFLNEELPSYPVYGPKAQIKKVKDFLLTCYDYLTETIGTGEHSLQRIFNGDWNDGVILGHFPKETHEDIIRNGESVLNAAMASYTLKVFGEMLRYVGDNDNSKKALKYANTQMKAVKVQWVGKWFKRAWLTEDIGWKGIDQLWLEPQPWAMIGGAADIEQSKILVKSIDKLVRQPSKIGARLLSKGLEAIERELGMRVNGGIWPSINGTLIWALSLINNEMAWDEWKKNSLAYHAENYPEVWYGIWSGPDVYNSNLSDFPGQTHFSEELISWKKKKGEKIYDDTLGVNWTDFPVMDLHPHAWPLYNTLHLIGAKFTVEGVDLAPVLPQDEYEFSSPILGLKKSKHEYSGWYSPLVEGTWKITLKLNPVEIGKIRSLELNGKQEEFVIDDDKIIWKGRSELNKPLRWKIDT
jgi:hypothetical protein